MRIVKNMALFITGTSLIVNLCSCTPSNQPAAVVPTVEPSPYLIPTVPGPTSTPTKFPTMSPPPTAVITEPPTASAIPHVIIVPTGGIEQPTLEGLAPGARPQVTPIENTNCHIKPGRQPNVVGFFLKGSVADVFGKDSTEEWVMIPNPQRDGEFCWVWTGSIQLTGSLEDVLLVP